MKTPTDDITPVPEDTETLQTYIQDRRVIGVSLHRHCRYCGQGVGVSRTYTLCTSSSAANCLDPEQNVAEAGGHRHSPS